jgi:hypothetical protein
MPNSNWPPRLATAFAILRGMMLVAFSLAMVFMPEQALPGSAIGPARSLGLMLASRTILLGSVLISLAVTRKRAGLGWVLLADALLQVFDTGMAIAEHGNAVALLPAALCGLDAWAGIVLLRSARMPTERVEQ